MSTMYIMLCIYKNTDIDSVCRYTFLLTIKITTITLKVI